MSAEGISKRKSTFKMLKEAKPKKMSYTYLIAFSSSSSWFSGFGMVLNDGLGTFTAGVTRSKSSARDCGKSPRTTNIE